jgi:RHS repeat-associated protein
VLRDAQNQSLALSAFSAINRITNRGYTGHEMVDGVDIIHMNGRIYDAKLARFLQADPFIQAPYNTQSLNRYSYVWNNPLNATDPSGYIGWFIFKAFLAYAISDVIVTIGINSGWSSGLIQAVSLAATFWIGGIGPESSLNFQTQVAVVATLGGITSVLQGGKFGHGFVAAGLSAIAGAAIKGAELIAGQEFLAKVVVGGTISEATGGKFANGAAGAAFATVVAVVGSALGGTKAVASEQGGASADVAQEKRTTVKLQHKNIPGGDALGNTDSDTYPQHAFVTVRDNATGEEWISRAGPGGEGGNPIFGSVKGITIENVPNSTQDHGAQVNHSQVVLTTDMAPQTIVDKLSTFTDGVNQAQNSYNPLLRNSNSFAYQAIEVLTGARPPTVVWAPGAQTELRIGK